MIRTNLLPDTQKATSKTAKEDAKVVCSPNVALVATGLAVCDQGCAAPEAVQAAGAAHRGYAVVVEDVAGEVAGGVELLPAKGRVLRYVLENVGEESNLRAGEGTLIHAEDRAVESFWEPVFACWVPEADMHDV